MQVILLSMVIVQTLYRNVFMLAVKLWLAVEPVFLRLQKKVYVESYSSSNPEWYVSEKIERTVGFDYWRCSSSWSQISDFRYYFTQDDDASVTTFSVNTTAQWNTVLSQLQLGDVVQAGITGNGHSIIITSVYNSANGVRYCGHTNDVTAEPISSFKSWMETKGFTTITVIRT